MVRFRPLSRLVLVSLVGSASFALAALQNVTVDDAVLTGTVVPQYLPSDSVWNIGNNCSVCFVKPDPSLAYNGTWHDTTYNSDNGYTQAIDFTFTGTALYIFFITANNVTDSTTFTNVEFVLDQVSVGTYTHTPSSSTDYQYNVPVYVNDSLPLGQHDMRVQPVNSGNQVLILFDYLIYTVDTSSSVSLSPTATSSPSPTSTGTSISPGLHVGVIVGGMVGAVTALVLVAACLFCYRRYKRRKNGKPSAEERTAMDPFILPRETVTTPLMGSTTSAYSTRLSAAKNKTGVSSMTLSPPNPAAAAVATTASSDAASTRNSHALVEQVEQLRDEVARLRHQQDSSRNTFELLGEAPPEYSLVHET